jgi:hypothetical protein
MFSADQLEETLKMMKIDYDDTFYEVYQGVGCEPIDKKNTKIKIQEEGERLWVLKEASMAF